MNPWNMNLKEIYDKITQVDKKILKNENKLEKQSLSSKAKETLSRGLKFLRESKQKLIKEKQKRHDKGETID